MFILLLLFSLLSFMHTRANEARKSEKMTHRKDLSVVSRLQYCTILLDLFAPKTETEEIAITQIN